MVSRLPILLSWHVAPLRLILDEVAPSLVPAVSDNQADRDLGILSDGTLTPVEVRRHAAELITFGVMQQLNAFVETAVHYLAGLVRNENYLYAKRTPPWHKSLQAIETDCSTRRELLPGWPAVSALREDVNRLKHAAGIVILRETPITMSTRVRSSPADVREIVDEVERWLLALNGVVVAKMENELS